MNKKVATMTAGFVAGWFSGIIVSASVSLSRKLSGYELPAISKWQNVRLQFGATQKNRIKSKSFFNTINWYICIKLNNYGTKYINSDWRIL
jgi:hypothetical protein